jgi:cell pole-organizing protein PopZ
MTDQTAQEPTMEEILASIRRIISEDDAPAETAAAPASTPEPTPEPAEASPAVTDETPSVQEPVAVEEDVLELTDRYEAPDAEHLGDLDIAPSEVEPEPFPQAPAVSESAFEPVSEPVAPEPASYPAATGDTLVGDSAATSAASAFAGLAASLRQPEPAAFSGGTGPTIDDLARQLLRPLLKEWLDANLPAIVEAQVRKEVERIARSAG